MLETYKHIIGEADPSKRAVRAVGLMNFVRLENNFDDHQKLERFNDILEAYNFHSRANQQSKEKTVLVLE